MRPKFICNCLFFRRQIIGLNNVAFLNMYKSPTEWQYNQKRTNNLWDTNILSYPTAGSCCWTLELTHNSLISSRVHSCWPTVSNILTYVKNMCLFELDELYLPLNKNRNPHFCRIYCMPRLTILWYFYVCDHLSQIRDMSRHFVPRWSICYIHV
jgi:hypothetical protein